ncbi:hypothetical protein FA13DRAFT_975185 [Coprinellus micaceus]|uniref:Uncharacterized protein n=1 Tax=Coprinellus micaceus TaxID=71717 RepID=A0A4Y7SYY1_COPMI|nr:hypothetical protein FA13DRAFT_975185 [Coprinellus micaceus]
MMFSGKYISVIRYRVLSFSAITLTSSIVPILSRRVASIQLRLCATSICLTGNGGALAQTVIWRVRYQGEAWSLAEPSLARITCFKIRYLLNCGGLLIIIK